MTAWSLSFSGAGHLLPYHLGAAQTLLKAQPPMVIRAVAGSSSGALAAAVMALFPRRLEEYTDRFLQERGHALTILKQMLRETESSSSDARPPSPLLLVGTTKCEDGTMRLFEFDPQESPRDPRLIPALQASCTIPKYFHPIDMFSKQQTLSYPDGIEIDGALYCDGGIAAPAPPTGLDDDQDSIQRIVISPIAGSSSSSELSIRPKDESFALPGMLTARCGTFRIRPSIQNVRAMVTSMGVASPGSLKEWHARGAQDAGIFLDMMNQTCNR